MEWSKYQKNIFKKLKGGEDSLIVQARAGCGKTKVIIECAQRLDPGEDVMLCAFNKAIQMELQDRAPEYTDVRTLHSVGLSALSNRFGRPKIDTSKTFNIIRQLKEDSDLDIDIDKDNFGDLLRMTSFAKNTGLTSGDEDELAQLAEDLDVADYSMDEKEAAEIVSEVLAVSCEQTDVIDFDDMIWFPHIFGLRTKKYDVVFVDEAQDLNNIQMGLVSKMASRKNSRILACGDDLQAIYQFRGAHHNALFEVVGDKRHDILSLPISYRCPKKVVEMAKAFAPDFEEYNLAPDGVVSNTVYPLMLNEVKPGDFVLGRTNAPLVKTCMALLAKGVPANMAGRDIGRGLMKIVKKSKKKDIRMFLHWLDEYLDKEKARLIAKDKKYKIPAVEDKVEVLQVIAYNVDTTNELIQKIEKLFSDDDARSKVICSTVHKAKGLERPRVWVLQDSFDYIRAKFVDGENVVDSAAAQRVEDNIYYVAITRAQQELYIVYGR